MKPSFLPIVALGAVGCVDSGPRVSETVSASTVGDYSTMGCSTAVVLGLSTQIADQVNCDHPGAFASFAAGSGITFASSAVMPYLEMTARDDLATVAQTVPLTITSGLRTVAQQYLLSSWAAQSMCGVIADAATGTSSHESGRAVDVSNYSAAVTAMTAHGWAHDVPTQPVHFDHTSSPADAGYDVLAFQELWNLNNPSDQIATDGQYGPMTEARLMMTPATGFAMGPTCNNMPPPPGTRNLAVVSIAGPDRVLPMTAVHFAIVLKNTGSVDWPATTQLTLANSTTSQLHDMSWTSDTVVTTLPVGVPVGGMGTVTFNVMTPEETMDTPVSETFALNDSGTQFGMISLALTVAPNPGGPSGSGSNMPGPMDPGGCDAGGGAASGSWLLLALAGLRGRRSRTK